MKNEMLELARRRYTAKRYDPAKPLSDETLNDILEILRLAPSSLNIQAWHFYALRSPEALAKIRPAVKDFNAERVENAPVVLIFAVDTDLNADKVRRLTAQERADGRYREVESIPGFVEKLEAFRIAGMEAYCQGPDRGVVWATHQAHIALGFLLLAAAGMGVDATTLGGMKFDEVDRILGLAERKQTAVMAVALGYHSADDRNATCPKSRFPLEQVATIL